MPKVNSPLTLLRMIKKAKEKYQKKKMTPAELAPKGKPADPKMSMLLDRFGPKSRVEQDYNVVSSTLLKLKSLKFPTGDEEPDPSAESKEARFAKQKTALLKGMKGYYKSLVKNKGDDPNKTELPKYLKVLTLVTVSVKGLSFATLEGTDTVDPDVDNLEEPSAEALKLLEGDDDDLLGDGAPVETPVPEPTPTVRETAPDPLAALRKEFAALGAPPAPLAAAHKKLLASIMFVTSADAVRPELETYKKALQDYKDYQQKLKDLTPALKRIARVESFKVTVAQGLANGDKEAKAGDYGKGLAFLVALEQEIAPADGILAIKEEFTALGEPPPGLAKKHQALLATLMFKPQLDPLKAEFGEYKKAVADQAEYAKRRGQLQTHFDGAKNIEAGKQPMEDQLQVLANLTTEGNFGEALKELPKALALATRIKAEAQATRDALNTDLGTLYDEVLFTNIGLNKPANTWRQEIGDKIKDWKLTDARRLVTEFKADIDRARKEAAKGPNDLRDLTEVQAKHSSAKLQNDRFARNTEMARSAAVRLVADDGTLMLGFLEELPFGQPNELRDTAGDIGGGKHKDLPQSKHALKMLQLMSDDTKGKKMREIVEKIPRPDEATNPGACAMIRTTLGLAPDTPVTAGHARQAALAALMTQMRQGDVGSCFATSCAIQAQTKHPEVFLQDMLDIMKDGKIKRKFKGKDVETPVNPEWSAGTLESKTTVNFANPNLHGTPSFQAALDAAGVPPDRHKAVVDNAVAALRVEKGLGGAAQGELKPEEILDKILQAQAGGKTPEQKAKERKSARDAYLAQQENRLLRAWEYTVAEMAELDEVQAKKVRSKAVTEIKDRLVDWMKSTPNNASYPRDQLAALRDDFNTKMEAALKSKVKVTYDAALGTPSASGDGHSSRGVWVMQRNDNGKKVTSKADQDALLREVFDEVKAGYTTNPQQKWINEANAPIKNSPVTKGEPLSTSGNTDPGIENLLTAFYNNDTGVVMAKKKPTGPKDMFKWVLEQTVALEDTIGTDVDKDKNDASLPLGGGPHMWSLKPGNNQFRDAVKTVKKGGKTSDGAIDDYVAAEKNKNKGLKDSALNPAMRQDVIEKTIKGWVGEANFASTVSSLSSALPMDLTVAQLVEAIGNWVKPEFKDDAKRRATAAVASVILPPVKGRNEIADGDAVTEADVFELFKKVFGADSKKDAIFDGIFKKLKDANTLTLDAAKKLIDKAIEASWNIFLKSGWKENLQKAKVHKPSPEIARMLDDAIAKLGLTAEQVKAVKANAGPRVLAKDNAEMKDVQKALSDALAAEKIKLDPDAAKQAKKIHEATTPPVQPKGIIFADSNWGDGDKEVVFSMVVNPLSGDLEMWQMNGDGSSARPMDAAQWINGKDWCMGHEVDKVGGVVA